MKTQHDPVFFNGASLFTFSLLLLMACNVEDLPDPKSMIGGAGNSIINRGDGYPEQEKTPIKLGRKLKNPYQKERMVRAWNAAYPHAQVSNLPVTHRQVTFYPATGEEAIAIEEAGIDVYTWPFGYEILNDGNDYTAPGTTETDVPVYYAVVPAGKPLPEGVTYTIEEELCLLPLETKATREAFYDAGLDYKEELIVSDEPPALPGDVDFTAKIIRLTEDKDPDPPVIGGKSGDYSDGDHGDKGQYASHCGCFQWSNEDKPAGCVKVEDTQWGLQPLAGVRVSFRNAFFSRRTHTDEHGCYRIDHDYWPGASGFVHFENWYADVRSLDYWLQGSLFGTHCDPLGYYDLTGSTHINNQELIYWKSTNLSSTSSSYYIAATFLNSLTSFMKYCAQDGIPAPPTPLRVVLMKNQSASSTPMFRHIGLSGYYSLLSGIMGPFYSAFAGTLFYPLLSPLFASIAPDLIIGYDYNDDFSYNSDRLRAVYYHELAHAVHYRSAGNALWTQNLEFVVGNGINDPYGYASVQNIPNQPLDDDHKRCQLIETWAYFLGSVYTHRTYGLNYTGAGSNTGTDICKYSWIGTLENAYKLKYFPYPLLQDLRDQPSDYCTGVIEYIGVNDNVNHGYTIKEMYDALGNNPGIQSWWASLPYTGQSTIDMNNLYQSYPYLQ